MKKRRLRIEYSTVFVSDRIQRRFNTVRIRIYHTVLFKIRKKHFFIAN